MLRALDLLEKVFPPAGAADLKSSLREACATQKLSPGLCGDFFKPVFMMKTAQNAP